MNNRNGFNSHPLDITNEDDIYFNSNTNYLNRTTNGNYSASSTINASTSILNDKSKPVTKRRLPKIPAQSTTLKTNKLNQTINFFIEIENVKWFYRLEQETSVNASTNTANPNIVITSDDTTSNETTINAKKWTYFNKLDSYNLELEYRNIQSKKLHSKENVDFNLVQVLDGLYEANLMTKKCYAIYWKAQSMIVMRSLWFSEQGEPMEEKSSEEIEKKHIEIFKEQLTRANEIDYSLNMEVCDSSINNDSTNSANTANANVNNKPEVIASINLDEGTVNWYSKDEIYWEKNKMSMKDNLKNLINRFNNKSGIRVVRGWKTVKQKDLSAEGDGKFTEVTHLVFVVHGIAQKLYENSIVKCCDDLRKECERRKKEFFPNSENQRFMFLPVDWRTSLILDDGIVESITIKTITFIRDKLNSSALDIMYYTSALFKTEIMNSLNSEVNRLYNLFCEKNKHFREKNGLVSFVAHSLGSVIVYDILTSYNSYIQLFNTYGEDTYQERILFNHFSHNDALLLNEYFSCKRRIQEIEKQLVKSNNNITSLEFQVENFFCLGSPLAVFLALRGVRPAGVGTQDHILPRNLSKHLFNVFHPSDPVAYRLEPLILKHYATKSALEIQKSSDAIAIKSGKFSYKEANERRVALNVDLKSALNTKNSSSNKRKEKDKDSKSAELEETFASISTSNSFNNYMNPNSPIEQVELDNALDFQLQESNFELMATVTAHSCYWTNKDVALFITNQLLSNTS